MNNKDHLVEQLTRGDPLTFFWPDFTGLNWAAQSKHLGKSFQNSPFYKMVNGKWMIQFGKLCCIHANLNVGPG